MLTPDLQQELLNNIAENVKETLRDPRFEAQTANMTWLTYELGMKFQKQDRTPEDIRNTPAHQNEIKLTNAMAFEMSVLNSVMLKDMFNEGIDDFFDDPHTASIFADMTAEQKEQSRRQLKNMVADRLDVTPTTEHGALFKATIENEYRKEVIAKDGDKAALRMNFVQEMLNPIDRTMNYIRNVTRDNLPEALQVLKHQHMKAPHCAKASMIGLADHTATLASESGVVQRTVKNVIIPVTRNVVPTTFIEHYNNDALTDEEIQWAVSAFDSAHRNSAPDYASFKKGDQPLFNDAELHIAELNPALAGGLKVKAVAEALSGSDISEINPTKNTRELFHPHIVDKRHENASIFEIIVDFIKDLLGINAKEKKQISEMQRAADANRAAYRGTVSKENREKISFNELSAENMVDKVTKNTEKQAPSKQKSAPSKGR